MTSRFRPWIRTRALLLLVVGASLFGTASPAGAQRDPFDPLVSTGTAADDTGSTSASTATQLEAGTESAPAIDTGAEETSLPTTGAGMSRWLAIAYVLLAVGGSLILLSKMLHGSDDGSKHIGK